MASGIVALVERQDWLEPVEAGLQKAVGEAYAAGGPTCRQIKNFLHGTWLGHPLHPVMTDFPIGAWTATVVLDALGNKCARAADTALSVGMIGAVGAAATGLTDWQAVDGKARRVGFLHGLLNLTAAGLLAASWIKRRNNDRAAGRKLALIGYGISVAAAYLGGNLVYSKQVGVNHTPGEGLPEDFVPVLAEAELREGEPRRVEANGVKVVLVRRGERIYALAEVCSHLGGPLAEGKLEDDSVRCPWHGSRFALEDGRVLDGPATHPQPCLEARVRDGRIEVRASRPT